MNSFGTAFDARSNPEMMKKAIIKEFGVRTISLCDINNVEKELENIEDIFVENGYTKETVRDYLSERQPKDIEDIEGQ